MSRWSRHSAWAEPIQRSAYAPLTWTAVVVPAIWVVRALFPAERSSERDAAPALLNRRYSAGEITAAEYEQARHVLDGEARDGMGSADRTLGEEEISAAEYEQARRALGG